MCGACLSGLSSRGQAPSSTCAISPRIAIIASQKRSSSASDSLSVGSTISVPGDREAQRRRVEAVVDQPLGDVLGADACSPPVVLQRPQVEDALVRDAAALDAGDVAAVVQLVVVGEARGDVVGAEDRGLGRAAAGRRAPIMRMYIQLIGSTAALPSGAAETAPTPPCRRRAAAGVAGQERHQVGDDADRADARPAAAVRDAEGLVQVEVADVAAELARRGDADQRVHVGAVDVHPAAVRGGRSRTARCTRASNTP